MERGRHAARRARAVRGCAAAAVAVVLAATAHTLSGGGAPPWWLLVAVTLLASPLAVALVGRAPALWRTSAVVAVSQALLHTAFAAVGADAPAAGVRHVHGGALLGIGSAGVVLDPGMIAGHALAALITTVLLVWGERMLRGIGRGLRRLLRLLPAHAPGSPSAPPRAVPVALPTLPRVHLASLSRRGPPAVFG